MTLTILALASQAAYLDWQAAQSNRNVLLNDEYNVKNVLSAGAAGLFLSAYGFSDSIS